MQRNILENRPVTTHTATTCCVQLDAPVQVQRQDSHNCWMRCCSDELCPSLCQPSVSVPCIWFLPRLAGHQPGCLRPGWSHGAHSRQDTRWCFGYPPVGAVLKRELISSWKWQVTKCYAYCKGLKTNACARCNPARFSEPRGKSSHTIVCASFIVSIIFPCLWKMLTMCGNLSNFKRNWTLLLLRGR